ncbi:cytosolic phospholipase A2 gamma-like [Electrophorus electricus]|uniref:cytosolic phospholipase A2 gamma-like n=1 Tax=Electrophorus electricus TaxID=8005 RepID=UPI0015D0A237|nr:cytosolic phospholipase A2 gamma-like [Electrophorus electricus]
MIGLLGSLSQLSEEKLLDCIMYLCGVSGSTWCMASVYKEPDWSNQMETVKQNIIKRLDQGKVTYYEQYKKLKKMCEKDNFSVTDIWASFIVSNAVKEIDEHVLTEQRGQHNNNPYPIYTVIDKKSKYDTLCKDSWFEITPHECGYSLTGAFVDTKCLGSRFVKGAKTEEHPESDMLYLQGLCGSALADGKEVKKTILEWLLRLIRCVGSFSTKCSDFNEGHSTQHLHSAPITASQFNSENKKESVNNDKLVMQTLLELNLHFISGKDRKCDKEGNEVKLQEPITDEILSNYTLKVCDCLADWFPNTEVNVIAKCMKKVYEWDWGTHYNFLYKMTVDEVHPSILKSKTRQYEDAGLLVNSPYFSVLRKERNVDLIISLDFSEGDPFETVDKAAQMCKDLQIPFPTVEHPGNIKEPEDFYVFKDNPNAPVVIHMPLFNAVNCKGEVKKWGKKYKTVYLVYREEMISDLLEKAGLNIKNTKEKLLKEIEEVIQRKKN